MTQNRYLDETYFEGDIFAQTAAVPQWRALDQTMIKKSRKKSWSSKWKFAIIVIIRPLIFCSVSTASMVVWLEWFQ